MAILTRAQILEAQDLPTETVAVLEWGGEVLVRGLTGTERDALEASMIDKKGKTTEVRLQNLRAKLVSMSVVDEHGNRVFSAEDVEALGKKAAVALERVFEVARRLSGLTSEDVDEITKN